MDYLPTKLIFRCFFLAVSFRESWSWNILGSTHSLQEMTSHYIPTGMSWTPKSWQTIICRTWSSIHSQRRGTTLTFSEEWNFPFPLWGKQLELNDHDTHDTRSNKVCAMFIFPTKKVDCHWFWTQKGPLKLGWYLTAPKKVGHPGFFSLQWFDLDRKHDDFWGSRYNQPKATYWVNRIRSIGT